MVSTSRAVRSHVDGRHAEAVILARVLRHFRERRRFETEVHLQPHRAVERVDDLDQAQAAGFDGKALGRARGEIEGVEIDAESPFDAGPQDLHGHRLALAAFADDFGAVHLRDRGGGDRRPEARIDRIERLLERLGDHRLGLLLAEGRHLVLQHFEVAGDVRADDVGPRSEELTELDVSGSEPRQGRAETAGAVAGAAALDDAADGDGPDHRHRQAARVDHAEHALAREHVAGARQPDEMSGGGDHNFQPECSATTPPVICRNETRRKPARSIMPAKACGLGNLRIDSTRY